MGRRNGQTPEAQLMSAPRVLPPQEADVSRTLTSLPHDKSLAEKRILGFFVFGGKNFCYGGRGRFLMGFPFLFLFFIEEERQSEAVGRKASKNALLRPPRFLRENVGRLAIHLKRSPRSPQLGALNVRE